MRGLILAGGNGSRLGPLSTSVNKHLLPVHNKPMIYYPLSTLLLAGIRDVRLVTSDINVPLFERLLGGGERFGIQISYEIQDFPLGIADGILSAATFVGAEKFAVILGDNIFHGSGIGGALQQYISREGATAFALPVANPSEYGVVSFSESGRPEDIQEKPISPKSKYAIPGLYFYDDTAIERVCSLKPSARGELEITDLNLSYLKDGLLAVPRLPRGSTWIDAGNAKSLAQAAEYVRTMEERQGVLVSSPEEIAWRMGYISDEELAQSAVKFAASDYGRDLAELLA